MSHRFHTESATAHIRALADLARETFSESLARSIRTDAELLRSELAVLEHHADASQGVTVIEAVPEVDGREKHLKGFGPAVQALYDHLRRDHHVQPDGDVLLPLILDSQHWGLHPSWEIKGYGPMVGNVSVHLPGEHDVDAEAMTMQDRYLAHLQAHSAGKFRPGREHFHSPLAKTPTGGR